MSSGRKGGVDEYVVISGGASDPKYIAGVVDPTAGPGVAAPEGSIYSRFVAAAGEFYIKSGAADTAWTQITGTGGSFGLDFASAVAAARTTTTSSTFQSKLTLATGTRSGTYRAGWMALLDNGGTEGEARLQNTTAGTTLTGTIVEKSGDSVNRIYVGGFLDDLALAGVSQTLAVQFRDVAGGNTQGIQQARIELWRVS